MSQPPRNFAEWMRTVERTLTEVKRNSQSSIASQINREIGKVKEEIELGTNDGRTPAAPIELVTQTYILPDFSGNMIGTIGLDFPDVVVATDATPLDVRKYEMWGRRTDDIAPEAEPRAMGLVATSEASSLTWDGVVPGATYEVAARALGVTTVRPGLMSQVVTVTVEKDLIPPPIPSALTLTQNLSVVTAAWDGLPSGLGEVMPQDFSYTEYRLRLPDGTFIEPGDQLFKAGNFYDANAPYNVAVYYSHRAVDTSGNKSGWSIESSISVTPLVDEDSIRDALQAASDRIDAVSVTISADMAELDGRLSTAETDLAASVVRLDDAEGVLTNLTGTILPQLSSDLDAAEATLATLPGKITANTTAISDAKTRLDNLDTTTLPGLSSDLAAALERIADNETAIAPLPGRIADAESDLTEAFSQLNTVDSRVATAKAAAIADAKADATAKAGQAKTDAIAAATLMTDGIGKNLSSTSAPTTSNLAPKGSVWRRTGANNTIIGVWEQTGTGIAGTWTPRLITSEVIDNLDVGKLSASTATINTAVISKLAVGVATVIQLNADRITAGTINADRLDINDLSAKIATVIKLNASAITTGTIDTARLNATTIASAVATIISLNADRITAGTINAARLDVIDLSARIATVINLNADRITAGTINTARLNTVAIAAATASIQTVDVRNLFAGAGTFQTAVIDKLWTDVITTRTINASQVNIGQGENMLPWGVLKPVGLRDVSNFMGYGGGGVRPAIQSLAGVVDGDHLYMDATWVTPGADVITWMITPGPYVNTSGTNGFVVEPGKEYMFSAYLKAGGSYGTYPGVRVSMYFYKADGGYVTAQHGTTKTITWAWDKHEVAAVAPSNAAYAVIYVRQNQPGGVRMDLPGFYLKKDASLIVDGGIEARHITASESLTAKIVTALSITADKLATNAVTADKISAGAITAVKIAANTITASQIAANAITASELATDSVLAINIKAGQITTAKIAAGAVTATEIAANSVYAQHMVIGTGNNIIPNAQLTSIAGWPGWGRNSSNGPGGNPSIWGLGRRNLLSDAFPVDGGKRYKFSVDVLAQYAGSRIYVQLNTDGSNPNPYMVINEIVLTSWKTFSGEFDMPSGATTGTINVYLNHPNGTSTTGYQWFTNWSLSTMTDGSLLVNGSIDGQTITGATFRTNSSASTVGGIQIDDIGIRAWDTSGNSTFYLQKSTGAVSMTGAFRSGRETRVQIDSNEPAPPITGMPSIPNSGSASVGFYVGSGFGTVSAGSLWASGGSGGVGTQMGLTNANGFLSFAYNKDGNEGGSVARIGSDIAMLESRRLEASKWVTVMQWYKGSGTHFPTFGLKTRSTTDGTYMSYNDMWTTTTAGNCYINTAGTFYRSTSSIKNKLDVEDLPPEKDDLILGLRARTWFDRGQSEALAQYVECEARGEESTDENLGHLRRVPGMVAEEVEAAGLTEFVEYGIDGQVEGLMYERLGVALIPVVGRLRDRVVALETSNEAMNDTLAALTSRLELLETA